MGDFLFIKNKMQTTKERREALQEHIILVKSLPEKGIIISLQESEALDYGQEDPRVAAGRNSLEELSRRR